MTVTSVGDVVPPTGENATLHWKTPVNDQQFGDSISFS